MQLVSTKPLKEFKINREVTDMPNSVRSLIRKCLHKGAITQQEYDKIIRKLDS